MAELGEADEAELQRLVAAEQQKAQFTAQVRGQGPGGRDKRVHHFMELCWDKCVEKPGNRLDSRTENCLSSCVDRFIDTTLAITSRFAQIVQKGGQ
ncbi:mitochondrial import inner membrane translocase subunit Tim8 B isoform X1 [Ailuropoda melanoleuca]|uniref:mitochondrial import inner membrane translocase subunit Tim8 B isoform X1 n=1 Tax=Ailuropoda melanoleuca TaxID=9646 RepID=UPI001494CF84|nr:mitochondrial import inner membrane translocase subunit Tim8 B isoform X1 [Ailuropoda melanoleuca]